MNRKYVIVSTKVEPIIQESIPDTEILLFKSISGLHDYIATTPVRALQLYITQEVLEPVIGTSLEWVIKIIDHPFMTVDKIYFIVDTTSGVDKAIHHIKETQQDRETWTIIRGALTRTYVNNVIIGVQKIDEFKPAKKAIFRQRRSSHVKENLGKQKTLPDAYEVEEDFLYDVPEQEEFASSSIERANSICKRNMITGIDSLERTVFSWMLAQYLSLTGKTVIVEKDIEFLKLGEIITKTGKNALLIDADRLFSDLPNVLADIRKSNTNLIAILTNRKNDYSYSFLVNILYNNLVNDISNLIIENDFEEVLSGNQYTVVLPANILDVLKTMDAIPYQYAKWFKYVALDMNDIEGLSITDGEALTNVVTDLMQDRVNQRIPIFRVNSLKLGGDLNEIHLFT